MNLENHNITQGTIKHLLCCPIDSDDESMTGVLMSVCKDSMLSILRVINIANMIERVVR